MTVPRLFHTRQTWMIVIEELETSLDNDEFERIFVDHVSTQVRHAARSFDLQFRKLAIKLEPTADNKSRPLAGR